MREDQKICDCGDYTNNQTGICDTCQMLDDMELKEEAKIRKALANMNNKKLKKEILALIEEAWESGSRTSSVYFPDRAKYESKIDKILEKSIAVRES